MLGIWMWLYQILPHSQSQVQEFLGTPQFQDSRASAYAHTLEDTNYVPFGLLQPVVVTQQKGRHSILGNPPESFHKEDQRHVCSIILGSACQVEAVSPGTAPRTLPSHLYLKDYRGTCSKFWMHPIQSYKNSRRGQDCRVPPISSSAPCAIQTIRFSILPVQVPRLFNVLLKHLQNISGCTTESFKCELDRYLATVPDEPLVPGLTQYRRWGSNSVIDWANSPYLHQQDNQLQQHKYLELDDFDWLILLFTRVEGTQKSNAYLAGTLDLSSWDSQRDDLLDPTNTIEWVSDGLAQGCNNSIANALE